MKLKREVRRGEQGVKTIKIFLLEKNEVYTTFFFIIQFWFLLLYKEGFTNPETAFALLMIEHANYHVLWKATARHHMLMYRASFQSEMLIDSGMEFTYRAIYITFGTLAAFDSIDRIFTKTNPQTEYRLY